MRSYQKHIIVKWNPQDKFHLEAPDTIKIHCRVLKKYYADKSERYVWWGKISKSGNLGIDHDLIIEINKQIEISQQETHLYLYCPDSPTPTLHVGLLQEVSKDNKNNNEHTPSYYQQVKYPVVFWFKLIDIKKISLAALDDLFDNGGNDYDPVSSNFYPMVVYEHKSMNYFKIQNNFLRELEGGIMRCFKTGSICAKESSIEVDPSTVFIAIPFQDKYLNAYKYVIKPTLKELGLNAWMAGEVVNNIDIMCKVCEGIQRSSKAIIDISGWNANVLFELGIVFGLSKEAIILKEDTETVPVDLGGLEYISYNKDRFEEFSIKLRQYLTHS